ncbi:DUF726 domain-containing protein [Serratia inhibens]|uniref:DUF726 domain-containing protein n=1 Tax=Serratia inhibens TaxID=2338073 RepID=UPI00025E2458|nr:DUF726 domain-containing protein [Serratia inhibens]ANS42653.1 hypothetical protein Q5A_010965 [Serratia inhibens PRI-2C]
MREIVLLNKEEKPLKIELYNEGAKGIPVVIAPGYMTDGDKSWAKKLSKVINSPIIFVQWKSSNHWKLLKGMILPTTSGMMTTGMMTTGMILPLAARMILPLAAGTVLPYRYVTLPTSVITGVRKSWRNSSNVANNAGKCLADFLNEVWDGEEKALFIGHSLGVRVITEAMKRLKNDNVLSSVSIAGAILQPIYDSNIELAKSVPLAKHVNIHSDSDWVLKYLYKVGELDLEKPIGVTESTLENVENINLDIGHVSYLSNKNFMRYIALHYKQARAMYYARGYEQD